jgi:hypothetical protein
LAPYYAESLESEGWEDPNVCDASGGNRNTRVHATNVASREQNWRDVIPVLRDEAVETALVHAQLRGKVWELKVAHVQSCIDVYAQTALAKGLHHASTRPIIYTDGIHTCELLAPSFTTLENTCLEIPATIAGCCPSSPLRPKYWYDVEDLMAFHSIRMCSGLASTAYCKAKETIKLLHPWLHVNIHDHMNVDVRLFEQAYHCFCAIYPQLADLDQLGNAESLDNDPLGICPVCADQPVHPQAATSADYDAAVAAVSRLAGAPDTSRMAAQSTNADNSTLDDMPSTSIDKEHSSSATPASIQHEHVSGLVPPSAAHHCIETINAARLCSNPVDLTPSHVEPSHASSSSSTVTNAHDILLTIQAAKRPLAVMADGNQKLTHHTNCGAVINDVHAKLGLPRLSSRYFGHLDSTLEAQVHQRSIASRQRRTAEDTDADVDACGANLTCARDESYVGVKALDVKCVVGMCCIHGIPAAGLYLSCVTPEQFIYYDILLEELLSKKKVDAFVLDINCQYKKHFAKLHPELAHDLQFWIGWLHSKAGHNLTCQLENSALYADLLGRTIGENMEHIWVRGTLLGTCMFENSQSRGLL